MTKDIKALLSVSLAAMDVSSSKNNEVDKDIMLDARDDEDESQSTHTDDTIPSMDGIPDQAFHWHG